ncbi:MAG: hypothetical protein H6711_01640 [Myxococcales bacterium]|nr:hypothetical protein [Myxococcales bacterium]
MTLRPRLTSLLALGIFATLALACDGDKPPPATAPPPVAGGSAGEGGGEAPGQPPGGSAGEGGGEAPGSAVRTPLVPKDHPLYGRMEGAGSQNACADDSACHKGGCSSEVCSAEEGVITTCEVLPVQIPASAFCGCVVGECVWYTTDGTTLPASGGDGGGGGGVGGSGGPSDPGGGVRCGDATCAPGEKCIEYFGIAGPSGPRFQTCGIPCGPKRTCPSGKKCVTIADGPGDVCQ